MRHAENITTPNSGLLRSAQLPQNTHTSRNTPTQPEKIEKTFKYTPPPTPAEAECSDLPPQASPGVPTGPCPPPRWGWGAPTGAGSGPTGPIPLPPPPRHRPMVLVAPCRAISRYIAACRALSRPGPTVSYRERFPRLSARAGGRREITAPTPRSAHSDWLPRPVTQPPACLRKCWQVMGEAGLSRGLPRVRRLESRRPRVRVLPPPSGPCLAGGVSTGMWWLGCDRGSARCICVSEALWAC